MPAERIVLRVIALKKCVMIAIRVREKYFIHQKVQTPMLPVIILDDRVALQAMVEEMYQELPERKPKKKKA